MSEEVCDFPDLGTVVSEGDPFFALVVDFVGLSFILHFLFQFSNERMGESVIVCYGKDFLQFFFFPFWREWQRCHPIDQVAADGGFVFCRVVRSEVNGGVGCCRFSVYISFYF
jgi:hypothetical protein